LTGVPQISIPGATVDGLPVGLSIVGGPGSDAILGRGGGRPHDRVMTTVNRQI